MRGIEFRGKRTYDNEWVYGNLLIRQKEFQGIAYEEYFISNYIDYEWKDEPVKEETIGQYTGVEDKNGKKIFEGDIVKDTSWKSEVNKKINVVKFCTTDVASCGCCYKPFEGSGFKADEICLSECEIIGNVWDNKELLEEQDAKNS